MKARTSIAKDELSTVHDVAGGIARRLSFNFSTVAGSVDWRPITEPVSDCFVEAIVRIQIWLLAILPDAADSPVANRGFVSTGGENVAFA